jgi:hypothetical protein
MAATSCVFSSRRSQVTREAKEGDLGTLTDMAETAMLRHWAGVMGRLQIAHSKGRNNISLNKKTVWNRVNFTLLVTGMLGLQEFSAALSFFTPLQKLS